MSGAGGIDSLILRDLYGTAAMREIFSDRARVQAMLDVEAALARAEAAAGVIPASAAAPIVAACDAGRFDLAEIGRQTPLGGNPAIPLVKLLTAAVEGDARHFVHWGATSQDIIDTGLMLQIRAGLDLLISDLEATGDAAARLAEANRQTAMVGRTLLQHAVPIPFGLKAASWLGLAGRSLERLRRLRLDGLAVQFGGAAGNLAALRTDGIRVTQRLAAELGLAEPEMPWHTARDRTVDIAAAVAIAAAGMAKIASDVMLLMQTEVAEAFEPSAPGKGGSSTMPHKRNPVGAAAIIASAVQAEARLPILLSAMRQEHERSPGLWHAEWGALAELFVLAHGAVSQTAALLIGLTIDPARMRANLEATNGLIYAEAASFALAEKLGREAARGKIETLIRQAVESGQHLREVVAADAEASKTIGADRITTLFQPEGQFGVADDFISRAIAAWDGVKGS